MRNTARDDTWLTFSELSQGSEGDLVFFLFPPPAGAECLGFGENPFEPDLISVCS